MKTETKFWNEIKAFNIKNNCKLSFTRLENSAAHGTPDLLVYNSFSNFFTVELKVTRGNKIRFSPHQIAFHIKHPNNTFILVSRLSDRGSKLSVHLYKGESISQLAACGLELDACCLGLDASINYLKNLN